MFDTRRFLISLIALFCIFSGTVFHAEDITMKTDSMISSPVCVTLSHDGHTLFIAEQDMYRISALNAQTGALERIYTLDFMPSGITLSSNDSLLYVTGGGSDGYLSIIETETGKTHNALFLGHTPGIPAIDSSDSLLYVANRFDNSVSVVDCTTTKVLTSIPALREPIDIALTPDDKTLIIANHLPTAYQIPEYMTDGGYMSLPGFNRAISYASSATLIIADTHTNKLTNIIHLPNGSTSLRGICVSQDSHYAYVTHILARYQVPTTQLERGWMNTNAISIIDLEQKKLINTVLIDDIMQGAANPWDISCSPDDNHLIVSHAGNHELSIIDRKALHDRLNKVSHGITVTEVSADSASVSRDFLFLNGIRTRVPLTVNGPRAFAAANNAVYVSGYFSDSVECIYFDQYGASSDWLSELHASMPVSDIRRGEQAFNDASFCFQSWQSCASCHPDGRADGLNWDLLNDGIGNPKNTKSLLYSHNTPPAMITGIRDDAETAVRAGLKYIQFVVHSESDALAIDAYLKSLEPVTSPYLNDPEITKALENGKQVFVEADCITCHSGPFYTDKKQYDVGIGTGRAYGTLFDTPTLNEVWRTEPYLYDGRARDMYEILTLFNTHDHHGETSSLTYTKRFELMCYLLSL